MCHGTMAKKKNVVSINEDLLIDKMNRYEYGKMTEQEIFRFFQEMINDGFVWTLQGFYQRMALRLIEEGHCKPKHVCRPGRHNWL